jgi:hypothetical protein
METKPTRPPRKPEKKGDLIGWMEQTKPRLIGEAEWDTLVRLLAPVSEGYLRRLLRDFSGESGVPLAPLVEGVRQESLPTLELSLLKLLSEYESGDAERRSRVRKVVIEAKEHAKLAARKPEIREAKAEMILWMLTWLENPPLFPNWVRLRRSALGLAETGKH